MTRITGDKNLNLREKRLVAEKEAEKAKTAAVKAKLKAEQLRAKELSRRV